MNVPNYVSNPGRFMPPERPQFSVGPLFDFSQKRSETDVVIRIEPDENFADDGPGILLFKDEHIKDIGNQFFVDRKILEKDGCFFNSDDENDINIRMITPELFQIFLEYLYNPFQFLTKRKMDMQTFLLDRIQDIIPLLRFMKAFGFQSVLNSFQNMWLIRNTDILNLTLKTFLDLFMLMDEFSFTDLFDHYIDDIVTSLKRQSVEIKLINHVFYIEYKSMMIGYPMENRTIIKEQKDY